MVRVKVLTDWAREGILVCDVLDNIMCVLYG